MPRKKASAPSRLNEDERENQNWNMSENGASGSGLPQTIFDVVIDDSDEEDDDFVPVEEQKKVTKRVTKAKKKPANIAPTDKDAEYEFLKENAEFNVTVWKTEANRSKWYSTIGTFEFELTEELKEEVKWEVSKSFALYFSEVPETSFANFRYCQYRQYIRIVDVPQETYEHMKAFANGLVGTKRRNIELNFAKIEGLKLIVNVDVMENLLYNFYHPSDVVAFVPNSVKRTIEHFFKLDNTGT